MPLVETVRSIEAKYIVPLIKSHMKARILNLPHIILGSSFYQLDRYTNSNLPKNCLF